jgi:hypothetical protein
MFIGPAFGLSEPGRTSGSGAVRRVNAWHAAVFGVTGGRRAGDGGQLYRQVSTASGRRRVAWLSPERSPMRIIANGTMMSPQHQAKRHYDRGEKS